MCAKPDSTATIKYNGSSIEPGLTNEELVRRKRKELGALSPEVADVADLAMRDVSSGRVRKARRGSTRSVLGMAFDSRAPLGADSILGGA